MILGIEQYLKENIDGNTKIKLWYKKNEIPIFLKNIYKFYELNIFETTFILLEILDDSPNIDMLKKHITRVEKLTSQQIVLYYKKISRHRRKSLIENRISFVMDDGQMFLPFLGMNLKKLPQEFEKKINSFSTSAQIAFLYFLYNENMVINATEFAQKFGLSTMTSSRAFKELYNNKLLTYQIGGKTGRSKKYRRISDPEYFKQGNLLIKSPIKEVVYVNKIPEGTPFAGLEALAELSMINPSKYRVRAIGNDEFKLKNLEIVKNKDLINDEYLLELQVWVYDPKWFVEKNHVDLVSLYATLKDESDERIEQALEEILRGEKWYMG